MTAGRFDERHCYRPYLYSKSKKPVVTPLSKRSHSSKTVAVVWGQGCTGDAGTRQVEGYNSITQACSGKGSIWIGMNKPTFIS